MNSIDTFASSRLAVYVTAGAVVLVLAAVGIARGEPSALPPEPKPSAWRHNAVELVVDIAGAVRKPGVYELPEGSRVRDLVAAAGGIRPGANTAAVNRAAPLVDGQQVVVPEVPAGAAHAPQPAAPTPATHAATAPVSLNGADAAALESLPGIGPATAAAIIEDRTANGPFGSVADLERVPGIGPATVASLEDAATL